MTVIACIIIMIGLSLFTKKSKMGKAMRAVSEDKDAAELMGINVNVTISLTFAIGSALAAIAGVLLCSAYPTLQPTTVLCRVSSFLRQYLAESARFRGYDRRCFARYNRDFQ